MGSDFALAAEEIRQVQDHGGDGRVFQRVQQPRKQRRGRVVATLKQRHEGQRGVLRSSRRIGDDQLGKGRQCVASLAGGQAGEQQMPGLAVSAQPWIQRGRAPHGFRLHARRRLSQSPVYGAQQCGPERLIVAQRPIIAARFRDAAQRRQARLGRLVGFQRHSRGAAPAIGSRSRRRVRQNSPNRAEVVLVARAWCR